METFRLTVEIFSGVVSFAVVVRWAFEYLEKKVQKLDRHATITLTSARPKSPYNEDDGIYRVALTVKPGKDPTVFTSVSAEGCLIMDPVVRNGKYIFEESEWRKEIPWELKVNADGEESSHFFFLKKEGGTIDGSELSFHIKNIFFLNTLKRTLFIEQKL